MQVKDTQATKKYKLEMYNSKSQRFVICEALQVKHLQ